MIPRLTVGVIGHVDHGKTALVRALTGMETDRLAEERRRGMSVVLGFAWFQTGRATIDLIDTPGHEAFVRTMVLGATGFDAALLVVAADEGVMPQTREHLAIARVFGLGDRLVVAISKLDRLEPGARAERVAHLTSEIRRLTGGAPPMAAVSARTGEGVETLRGRLTALLGRTPERGAHSGFWLPVDRAFSPAGFGLVVTGTLHGGTVRQGDAVVVTPGGREGQIRQLQVHGRSERAAEPGGRVALNLRGLSVSDLPRGAMVASPGMVTTTDTIDVSVHMDVDVGARLRSGAHVRLMVGAADVAARIRLLHAAELSPGEGGFARLLTDQLIPVRPGARFVLRRPSPPLTLGGGTLLDVPDTQACGLRRGDLGALARLSALAAGDGVGAARASLADAGLKGCSAADIARWAGPGPRAGDLSALQLRSGRWVSEAAVRGLAQRLASGTTPVELPALAAREVAPADVLEAAAAWLVALGRHRLVDGQLHEADPGSDGALDTALESDFRAAGLASLPLATVVGGEPARAAAVGRLLKAQRLVRLRHAQGRHPIVLHATVLADAEARLRSVWADGGTFTVAAVRDAFGLTRRDILPLLEHFDATGVTARRGEVRQLRGGHTVSGGD